MYFKNFKDAIVEIDGSVYKATLFDHFTGRKGIEVFFDDAETNFKFASQEGLKKVTILERIPGSQVIQKIEKFGELLSYNNESNLKTRFKTTLLFI